MDYVPFSKEEIKGQLSDIGIKSIDSLLETIPKPIRNVNFNLPEGMSEIDAEYRFNTLANKNLDINEYVCYLGGGAYDHYIPALISALANRSEFVTSYTPYQPEASQGTLQAIFEYQSMICEITGLELSNASLYDGATACAEAILVLLNSSKRKDEILVAESLHPYYRKVIDTYLRHLDIKVIPVPSTDGAIDFESLTELLSDKVAGLIVQSPNFFGSIENVKKLTEEIHSCGAKIIMVCNPISLGILASPAECDVDIAVGDGQPFGVDLSFGGPYFGFIASKKTFMRKMPGRIVGQTKDADNKDCFVLTLQAREQHIRREKATSNICTNQALIALRGAIYLAWLGKEGFYDLAKQNTEKAHYLANKLSELDGIELYFDKPFFNEFCIRITPDISVKKILTDFEKEKIFAGIDIHAFHKKYPNCLMIAVTEKRTLCELDRFVSVMNNILEGK